MPILLDGLVETGDFDLFDILEGLLELGRFAPNVGPVAVTDAGSETGTDGIEHILRRVDVFGTDGSITSKVVANRGSILPDIPKVDLQE